MSGEENTPKVEKKEKIKDTKKSKEKSKKSSKKTKQQTQNGINPNSNENIETDKVNIVKTNEIVNDISENDMRPNEKETEKNNENEVENGNENEIENQTENENENENETENGSENESENKNENENQSAVEITNENEQRHNSMSEDKTTVTTETSMENSKDKKRESYLRKQRKYLPSPIDVSDLQTKLQAMSNKNRSKLQELLAKDNTNLCIYDPTNLDSLQNIKSDGPPIISDELLLINKHQQINNIKQNNDNMTLTVMCCFHSILFDLLYSHYTCTIHFQKERRDMVMAA